VNSGGLRPGLLGCSDVHKFTSGNAASARPAGIAPARLAASYRSSPSWDWIKIKNPDSPAMRRHPSGSGEVRAGIWMAFGTAQSARM
jgi:hypothetical protein